MKWKDLSDKTQKEKQMGFLKRLFGTIEKVNKGEAPIEELDQAFVFDLEAEADDYWRQMEQNLLINAVKAAGGPEAVERAFVLANFKENQETFELFYQVNGQLLSWREMDATVVDKISNQLLPQAAEVARAVNENYEEVVSGWRAILEQEVPHRPLDSDRPFPYFEV